MGPGERQRVEFGLDGLSGIEDEDAQSGPLDHAFGEARAALFEAVAAGAKSFTEKEFPQLSYDQHSRVQALRVAREVLGSRPFASATLGQFDGIDLIQVAQYILTGEVEVINDDES